MTNPVVDKKWHIDKTIPITLLAGLLIQTGGAVWWARGLDARISALEENKLTNANQVTQLNSIAVDVAVLKENVKTTKDDISSMKNAFEMVLQQVLQDKPRR